MRFDIDDYKTRTDRLHWDDLDLDAFRDRAARRRHVAGHRVHARRRAAHDLLPARPARDAGPRRPRRDHVPQLLGVRGAVARRGARATCSPPTAGRPVAARVGPLRDRLGLRDRIRPYVSQLGSMLVGERLVALHMTWGAVNEWTTQAAYARLAQRAGHPVLTELTKRIGRQEGRHIDFYAAEATRRLGDSRGRPARRAVGAAPAVAPGRVGHHADGRDRLRDPPPLRRRRRAAVRRAHRPAHRRPARPGRAAARGGRRRCHVGAGTTPPIRGSAAGSLALIA